MAPRKPPVSLVAFAGAVLATLLVAACSRDVPQSTFGTHGPVARQQLNLFWLIFWIAVVVFILVEGLLVYSLIRFRRKPGEEGLPPQIHGNTRLELAWTIVPIILLVIVAVPTFIVIADESTPPDDPGKVNVTVVGHQWWWEFRYPDLGVVTAGELHIPVDRVVDFTLNSQDVIHSFWVPKLAGKTDVIPRHDNRMWFVASDAGTYWGECGEMCGIDHGLMRFRVIAEPQADFDAWVRAQKAPPAAITDQLALKGQQAFASKGCLVCHTVNSTDLNRAVADGDARMKGFLGGAALFPAPNLTTFSTRTTFAGGILPPTEDNLRTWVADPNGIKPGNRMAELAAAYQRGQRPSQEEVDAIVAYLLSLKNDVNAPPPTPTPQAGPTTVPPGATTTPGPAAPGGKADLKIATRGNDLAFDEKTLTVKAGSDVTVTLVNNATTKAMQHNWVLVKKGAEDKVASDGVGAGPANGWVRKDDPSVIALVPLIDGGATNSVTFKAPPAGTYGFICSFPGHWVSMRGTFEVQG